VTRRGVSAADARHIWHPYTQHGIAAPALEISAAKGAYLITPDGRRILDLISSWWVTLHGHAEESIARAIADQCGKLEQVIFTSFTHESAALLAEELCEVLPDGLERVFFSDDGSTAVEAALKMAFQFWHNRGERRTHIVAIENSYHGDTFGAMSASARGVFTAPFRSNLFDASYLPGPPDGDTAGALESLLATDARRIAAIIVEPMLQGAGGMLVWNPTTLSSVAAIAKSHGIPLIADEVLTGFGRTGPLFACEHAGVSPDIICLSKGITGGFLPLGATVATEEIFQAFSGSDRERMLFHGHSYTANPIACAAARASLALLDEKSAERRAGIERAHRTGLDRIRSHPRVRNCRVIGTVAAFDIGDGRDYLRPVGLELAAFALKRDVLLRPLGNVAYLLPPYCTTAEELTLAYDVIAEFLESN
jgi:adenosylmethionine-8-amino-7-oxononanoate aminotransferase